MWAFLSSSAVLAALLSWPLMAGPAQADTNCPAAAVGFSAGDGSGAPYEIDSLAELQLLKEDSTYWDDSFVLTGNVDMNGCTWSTAVGDASIAFTGIFDGDGHSITNATVTVTSNTGDALSGIFGRAASGAAFVDLTVSGAITAETTTGGQWAVAGGIVGRADTVTISGVSFTGSVTAKSSVDHPMAGGIVGEGMDVHISSVGVRANLSATQVGRAAAGGVAGSLQARNPGTSSIDNAWVTGTIVTEADAQASSGGIAGWTGTIDITRSFADVKVRASNGSEPAAGGIVGGGRASLDNTFATASIVSTRMAGGLVGWSIQDNATDFALSDSYFTGTLSNGGDQALGGLIGRADYLSSVDYQAPGSVWNQQVSGVSDAAGYAEFVDGGGTGDPIVFGALGASTASMNSQATYAGQGWAIDNTFPTSDPWSLCPAYNDGYPYLTNFFSTSPCSAVAPASLAPASQTITGVVGSSISTAPLVVTGFTSPFFTIYPELPTGLTLNALTGVISGTVSSRVGADTTYTLTAVSASLPMQRASSTITQTATPMPPTEPGQISKFPEDQPNDGNFQAIASRPTDGHSLVISYGWARDGSSNLDDSLYAFLLDGEGEVIGDAVAFVDGTIDIGNYGQQPAVAYNPVTGGWLVCYAALSAGNSVPTCQYLNADATASGAAFAIAPQFPDLYNQSAISYDASTQRFLVASTAWTTGAAARFVAANGSGVLGVPIDIASYTTTAISREGGLDLAHSPTSNTYLLTVRGRAGGGEQLAPWAYHLDGSGIPTGEPVRFTSTVSDWLSNGSLAYNAADDEFMMVAMSFDGQKPLGALRFQAASGQPDPGGPVWTDFGAPFTQPGTRYRPAIAAHSSAAEFLVSLPITLASASSRLLYYVVPVGADGTGGIAQYVDGDSTEVVGARPRIAFNDKSCAFVTTYQKDSTSWSYQLFGATIPASTPCASPTPPSPTPPVPPSAPLNAAATAGDRAAIVTWAAPAESGSSAVGSYQVTAVPGGATCLATAPARSCRVTGLANGTSYTFRVRALNSAGWGSYSDPSNAVTPRRSSEPSMVITGYRGTGKDARRVYVVGSAVGMDGMRVTAYMRFPGQTSFTPGSATRTVAQGKFDWSRKSSKRITVYFSDDDVRSNRIVIAAR